MNEVNNEINQEKLKKEARRIIGELEKDLLDKGMTEEQIDAIYQQMFQIHEMKKENESRKEPYTLEELDKLDIEDIDVSLIDFNYDVVFNSKLSRELFPMGIRFDIIKSIVGIPLTDELKKGLTDMRRIREIMNVNGLTFNSTEELDNICREFYTNNKNKVDGLFREKINAKKNREQVFYPHWQDNLEAFSLNSQIK